MSWPAYERALFGLAALPAWTEDSADAARRDGETRTASQEAALAAAREQADALRRDVDGQLARARRLLDEGLGTPELVPAKVRPSPAPSGLTATAALEALTAVVARLDNAVQRSLSERAEHQDAAREAERARLERVRAEKDRVAREQSARLARLAQEASTARTRAARRRLLVRVVGGAALASALTVLASAVGRAG